MGKDRDKGQTKKYETKEKKNLFKNGNKNA